MTIFLNKLLTLLYWVAIGGMLSWFVYSKGWVFANFKSIDASEALRLLEDDNNVTLLDVRTIGEYKEGHLRDATLIPLDALEQNLGLLKSDKQKQIIVYCASGNRSVSASRILEANGFVPLNVRGGLSDLMGGGAELIK